MRCPNCGLELADGAVATCPRCGYALAAVPPRDVSGPYAGWGTSPTDPGTTQGMPPTPEYPGYGAPMPPSPYAAPPSAPLGGPSNPYQSGPYQPQPGPYGAPPSQPLAPGQPAPGGWPPPPPGYGMPGFGAPGQPSGYPPPYGAPPSMPLAPGQTYPGYPGYAQQPPKPARRGLPAVVGALVAVLVIAVALGGLYIWGTGGLSSPATNGGTGTPGATAGVGTATAGATTTTTTATTGAVIYADSLTGTAANWPHDSHCGPTSAGYRVAPNIICYAPVDNLGDGSVTVEATQSSGPTDQVYGLVLRRASQDNYYLFGVDSNGEWVFGKCTSTDSTCTPIQDFTTTAAVHKGLNTKNTLSVQMSGTHFTFTINGTQVGQVDDATYASGWVGLASGDKMEALFQNISVTK